MMKKHMRHLFSLLMALCMVGSIFVPTAWAADASNTGVLVGEEAVSEDIKDYLLDSGITVNETTEFQLAAPAETSRMSRTTVKNALVVVNEDEDSHTVTKDFVLLYNEDGPVEYEVIEETGARTYTSASFDFPASGQDYYVVHATAFYYGYKTSPYYGIYQYIRPMSVQCSYEKYKNCTVSQLTVTYVVDGDECDYPSLSNTGNAARWEITISQQNPIANRTYSKAQNYPSNKVIYLGGGPLSGDGISFSITVNGKTEHDLYTIN